MNKRIIELGPDSSGGVETVSEFTDRLRRVLEREIEPCWIGGEISNVRRQSSGHTYFSLKDERSQISAVLFRGDAVRQEFQIRDGMQVVAFGEISIYSPRGSYQLIVRHLVEAGIGRLQHEFELLKKKLAAEGLFDPERKKPIPLLPSTIGFITSADGAAAQDFIRILKRRGWCGRVVILPSKVQGKEAAGEMVSLLDYVAQTPLFDLVVIGRGGGSLEDLWAFNEEALVRAVAAFPLPIISAVGHEIDFTLCDFAADRRSETPSGAAELISSGFLECRDRCAIAWERLSTRILNQLKDNARQLEIFRRRLENLSPRNQVEQGFLRLDDLARRLHSAALEGWYRRQNRLAELSSRLQGQSPEHSFRLYSQEFLSMRGRFLHLLEREVEGFFEKLLFAEKRLQNLDPQAVLNRGYVLVRNEEGRLISRKSDIVPGSKLMNQFADGNITVRVEKE